MISGRYHQLAVGSYVLQLETWESRGEMTQFLERCNLGLLQLEDDTSPSDLGFSITVCSEEGRFGIGFCGSNYGLNPALLIDYPDRNIIIGFGQTVKTVNLNERALVAETDLNCPFYAFHSLQHLGISDFYLVSGEICVQALTYQGHLMWRFDAPDIISDLRISRDRVEVNFMDRWPGISLRITNGAIGWD